MDPNIQPPNPHEMPFLRALALLVFALLIAVLSSLGTYWYVSNQIGQQTQQQIYKQTPSAELSVPASPNTTADWKTYTSKEGKLAFKYPQYYTLHINAVHGFEEPYKSTPNAYELDATENSNVNKNLPSDYPSDAKITFTKLPAETTLETYAQKNGCGEGEGFTTPYPGFLNTPPNVMNRNQIRVDGLPAISCYNEGPGGYDFVVVIQNDNLFYSIYSPNAGESLYQSFFNQFFSTFKFTK